MKKLTRVLGCAMLLASTTTPCFALDYEAKPVNWVLQAPVRLVGALSGAAVSGAFAGPVDNSYNWFLKGTTHVAEKLGDEKGMAQLATAAPTGGVVGAGLGAGYGVLDGLRTGFKAGWNKPFSRWSYLNVDEDSK